MKKPSGLMEKPFPKFSEPYISSFPTESDLAVMKLMSSYPIIGLPFIELRNEFSSNLLALVLEKSQEAPSWNF